MLGLGSDLSPIYIQNKPEEIVNNIRKQRNKVRRLDLVYGAVASSTGKSVVSVAMSLATERGLATSLVGRPVVSVAISSANLSGFVPTSLTSLGGIVAISWPDANPL